uniref:Myb/SANT-like domain-containing protein n=1 Tax=Spongospora subterranea TaxID=70186 RepID=A0A0H5QJR2_9EUKA|eukprot:CRZ01867.1 hypothetical protein [Spongospora subterranea]
MPLKTRVLSVETLFLSKPGYFFKMACLVAFFCGFENPDFHFKTRVFENLFGIGYCVGYLLASSLNHSMTIYPMPGAKQAIRGSRAAWDLDKDAVLISLMLEQARNGKRADSGFKKEAWTAVLVSLNSQFDLYYTLDQIKNRVKLLKKQYCLFRRLKDNSGFGWDDDKKIPTASDEVWDEYLEAHPNAALYRFTTLPLFEELNALFDQSSATGGGALASSGFFPLARPALLDISFEDVHELSESEPGIQPYDSDPDGFAESSPAPSLQHSSRRAQFSSTSASASLEGVIKRQRLNLTPSQVKLPKQVARVRSTGATKLADAISGLGQKPAFTIHAVAINFVRMFQ